MQRLFLRAAALAREEIAAFALITLVADAACATIAETSLAPSACWSATTLSQQSPEGIKVAAKSASKPTLARMIPGF